MSGASARRGAHVTTLSRLGSLAQDHPLLFSGAWFGLVALLLVLPLGAMLLLFMGLEVLGGRPVGAYAAMIFISVGLPPVPALGMSALVGPRILRLPSDSHGRAAGWGAAAALGALLLWALLLEGIPRVLRLEMQTIGGGDVPGAAAVVGYVVVLPLMVGLSLLVGAAAGALLHALAALGQASGTHPEEGAQVMGKGE